MQLYGSDPNSLADAARWAEDHGAAIVDLNMGCPADKVTNRNAGSKLLCDPDLALSIIDRLVKSLRRIPLTVKMRLGWDDNSIAAPYLAPRLESAGVAMIAVHGRTTQMQYSGHARLDDIARVVSSVKSIPVIGNGDIRSPQDAKRMLDYTHCAGVMIGRYALSTPWIFRDTWSYLTTGSIPSPPTIEEKCQLMRDHFRNLLQFRGMRMAVLEFRRRATWYGKQMNPCRMLREQMRFISTPADFDRAITQFLDWRLDHDRQKKTGSRPGRLPVS
jgi:nifR3 family TIM-barrel protein